MNGGSSTNTSYVFNSPFSGSKKLSYSASATDLSSALVYDQSVTIQVNSNKGSISVIDPN